LLEGLDDVIQEALVDFPGKIGGSSRLPRENWKIPRQIPRSPLHTHASYDEWTSSLCSTKSEDDFRDGKGKLLSMADRETASKNVC
jgi:hypothetical protein